LLMSGMQIFNAHPALYWGNASNFDHPLVAIGGFPDWATLPGTQWLAMGRRWHFFFAWLFVTNGIELVADFAGIGDGKGGYWEDQGYEWWAGI
jgi:thiosulfate reductase cytochrome b subunit